MDKSTIDFSYLKAHKGMFSYMDLDKGQVQKMIEQYAIYLPDNGRISIPGLSMSNIDYVVDSLIRVCGQNA
jgi:aspartate aminotransferase/aromatic-amino-acid transaminase